MLPMGGYKGYGLNVVIGMLGAVLNGAFFGLSNLTSEEDLVTPENAGHMVFAMRVDNFRPVDEFKRAMDQIIREIRDTERMEGVDRILLPGEIEFHKIEERKKHGVPLDPAVVEKLRRIADELDLPDRLD